MYSLKFSTIYCRFFYLGILTNMGEQEAISLYQKSKRFPPEVQRLIKKEVCGKWPKVFPFSNWCAYTEVIKQKQASFLENAVDNVIRGNEVINVLYFNLILFSIMYMWCIAQTLFTGPINVDQKFIFFNFGFSISVLNPNLGT